MRKAGRTDANQQGLVKMLRQAGVSVQVLSGVGNGCPDLLCGWRGRNTLLELKDEDKPRSSKTLTTDEKSWHENWGGQVAVVENFDEAIEAIVAVKGR